MQFKETAISAHIALIRIAIQCDCFLFFFYLCYFFEATVSLILTRMPFHFDRCVTIFISHSFGIFQFAFLFARLFICLFTDDIGRFPSIHIESY